MNPLPRPFPTHHVEVRLVLGPLEELHDVGVARHTLHQVDLSEHVLALLLAGELELRDGLHGDPARCEWGRGEQASGCECYCDGVMVAAGVSPPLPAPSDSERHGNAPLSQTDTRAVPGRARARILHPATHFLPSDFLTASRTSPNPPRPSTLPSVYRDSSAPKARPGGRGVPSLWDSPEPGDTADGLDALQPML
jgi:hypothetical protein